MYVLVRSHDACIAISLLSQNPAPAEGGEHNLHDTRPSVHVGQRIGGGLPSDQAKPRLRHFILDTMPARNRFW